MTPIALFLIFSMLWVLWCDGTRYIIPNWLVAAMLLVYPVALVMLQRNIDWKLSLAGAAMVLVIGYVVFAKRLMGGGDIKLLTACALWVGLDVLPDYVMLVALIGGVLAVAVWLARKALLKLPKPIPKASLPRILRDGEPIPYGIAIATAFLWMMWTGKVLLAL